MSLLPTVTTIVAEVALSLHPILIKQIPVNIPTQLLARLSTYSVLGLALSDQKDRELTWGSSETIISSILYGLMNLVHIGSSYLSYQYLPAGSALALFYTYPFFNIIASVLFLGESFNIYLLPLFILAFIGVLLISKYTKDGNGKDTKDKLTDNTKIGIAAAIVSALTETMIFFIVKTAERPTPFLNMLQLYPAAAALLAIWIFGQGIPISSNSKDWVPLLVFNIFIGFIGYCLRFFSIPLLPTAIFSLLTFIGVASGYGWGLLYANEKPNIYSALGAGCITGSLGLMRLFGLS